MDSVFESDAEALWQDALDLLVEQHISEPLAAMLRSCTPKSLEDGTLTITTSMRLVQKTVLKNSSTIENCLSQAAFENIALEVELGDSKPRQAPHQAAPEPQRDDDLWDHLPQREPEVRKNPLVEPVTDNDSRLTFERFIQGDENVFAYQAALQDPQFRATDDCGVVRRYLPSVKVYVVEGEEQNRKITFKEDLIG